MFQIFSHSHNFKYSAPDNFMVIHLKICAHKWMLKSVLCVFLTTVSFFSSFPSLLPQQYGKVANRQKETSACSRTFSRVQTPSIGGLSLYSHILEYPHLFSYNIVSFIFNVKKRQRFKK